MQRQHGQLNTIGGLYWSCKRIDSGQCHAMVQRGFLYMLSQDSGWLMPYNVHVANTYVPCTTPTKCGGSIAHEGFVY